MILGIDLKGTGIPVVGPGGIEELVRQLIPDQVLFFSFQGKEGKATVLGLDLSTSDKELIQSKLRVEVEIAA